MLTAFAIRRRALACAMLVGATSSCWGQTTAVLAQGPADGDERYVAQEAVDRPPAATSQDAALPTPALPDWPDQATGSVYSRARETGGLPAADSSHDAPAPLTTAPDRDPPLRTASFSAERDRRRLGPPKVDRPPTAVKRKPLADSGSLLPKFGLPLDSIYTTGTALAIVVGLLLLCVWALRRGARRSTALLPEDVVSVLGRVPLAARQFAQLVRVGNKLVLLSVTPAGAETLTEITDPVEIDRLLGLCLERQSHSSTSEFDDVFRKLATETAPAGFLGQDTLPLAAGHSAPSLAGRRVAASDAYAAHRGGADRG